MAGCDAGCVASGEAGDPGAPQELTSCAAPYHRPVLRIATVNVNGIRAAHRRGFGDWLATRGCDVVTLQEVRCPATALPDGAFGDFHATYEPGELSGRNGVAVLTRNPPAAVRTWGLIAGRAAARDERRVETPLPRGLRTHANEGRYVEVDLADVPLTVASLYLPKGGLPAHMQDARRMREAPDGGRKYERKMAFLAGFARYLTAARRSARAAGREFLLTGDLNVAHTRYDVAAWRRSSQVEGFLPEERDWLDAQLSPRTLVDVVRSLHPDTDGPYSWWSWLGTTYERDAGWRIDYQLATPALARTAREAVVDRGHNGTRLSDHAPVVVDYDWSPRLVGRAAARDERSVETSDRWQNRHMSSATQEPQDFSVVAEGDVTALPGDPAKFAGEVTRQTVLPAQRENGLRGDRFAYGPGARSAWHVHHGEQALVVVEGDGLIQWEVLDEPRPLTVGDWIHVQPGVPHWHGAAPDSEFVHLAITASGPTEWRDHVERDDAPD